MLPDRNTILQEDERMPSYTPKIDFERNRIMGTVDNIDAMEQAIYLILQTERYESIIYNWYYGVEFDTLIGKSRELIVSELERRIREALTEDDRINRISDFEIEFTSDKAIVTFTVNTIFGDIEISEWEVLV
jgi:hypothetical protein